MKKIILVLIAGIITLSAVEWEYEQLDFQSDGIPGLVLDSGNNPSIICQDSMENESLQRLWLLTKTESEWNHRYITASIRDFEYSIDLTSGDNPVVAYSAIGEGGFRDLFLAVDSTGDFDSLRLTDDFASQHSPVVKVDANNRIHLVYRLRETEDDTADLYYGWVESGVFNTEMIAGNLHYRSWSFDFLLDNEDKPHVFFKTVDGVLQHVSRISEGNWEIESVVSQGVSPSADVDASGDFHIAYAGSGRVYYISNKGGSWESELIAQGTGSDNYEKPCLSLCSLGYPHVVWYHWVAPVRLSQPGWTYEIYYSGKLNETWLDPEPIPPDFFKIYGGRQPFEIDNAGYGHIVYTIGDHLYYDKTAHPLSSGITENNPRTLPLSLEVTESEIHFSLTKACMVTLDIYDISGRMIERLASGYYPAGEHIVPFSTTNLSSGVYFVRGRVGEYDSSVKFVVTR